MKYSTFLALLLTVVPCVANAGLYFDPAMLADDSSLVADLTRFETEGSQLPGVYSVKVYLNSRYITTRKISFVALDRAKLNSSHNVHDNTGLMPCLSKKMLLDMGVKVSAFPRMASATDDSCLVPEQDIPHAYTAFDFEQMRLNISIPQAVINRRPDGWISPKQWSDGINAALLNYRLSGDQYQGSSDSGRSLYMNLTSGLNLGAWRFRDNSAWSVGSKDSHKRWQHLNTYVQRAIIPWRSELTFGDGSTGNDVFDSVPYRGIQLGSDDEMYPDSQRGFAPSIRGTAYSNARVSIWQNGNEIYRTSVAPGPFVIDDLYPLSTGGDLKVVVTESDGTHRISLVPYSSVPVLQRAGHHRYGFTIGRYRSGSSAYVSPTFLQGSWVQGLMQGVTLFGGLQLAERYRAGSFGSGMNLGAMGAVSFDVTQAKSTLADGTVHCGQSLRFLYERSLEEIGTTVRLAGYRYSTQGFHTLDETALKSLSGRHHSVQDGSVLNRHSDTADWADVYDVTANRRERLQVNLSQQLGSLGAFYASASRETYWQLKNATKSLQLGFNGHVSRVSYNVAYTFNQAAGYSKADRSLSLTLSVPFGENTPSQHAGIRNLAASYGVSRDARGQLTQQAGISGTAGNKDALSWSISQGHDTTGGRSGDASLDYQGRYGEASLGYGYSTGYQQVRYGLAGGMVLHSGGMTLGHPLGDTNLLVVAPGVGDVAIDSGMDVSTDWRGYALVPNAARYRANRVALNVSQLDDHTEINDNVTRVVPTRGAIALARFSVRRGVRALFSLIHSGKAVPFGATVKVSDGEVGMVGDEGQVYLSGLAPQGTLKVTWGRGAEQQCTAKYHFSGHESKLSLVQQQASCE